MYKAARLQGGDLPTLKSMADDPAFAETEWQKIILSELPYAKTRPAVEIYPDASLEWSQAFQETCSARRRRNRRWPTPKNGPWRSPRKRATSSNSRGHQRWSG